MSKSRFKIAVLLPIMTFLSGCGLIDSAVRMSRAMLLIAAVFIQLVYCLCTIPSLIEATIRSRRGTNVVTRFVRNSVFSLSLKGAFMVGVVMSVISAMLGFVSVGLKGLLCCVPSTVLVVLSLVFLYKDTQSDERVNDSRVITKATASGVKQTARGVGVAAGTLLNGVTGGIAGDMIGDVVDSFADTVDSNMEVEGAIDVKLDDVGDRLAELMKFLNVDEFMEKARLTGIPTEERTLHDVSEDIIKCAPEYRQIEVKENKKCPEEVAAEILGLYTCPVCGGEHVK